MKIFSAAQFREWDQATIQNEPISSVDLMERAATKCVEWLQKKGFHRHPIKIFCGTGNNGGDGLAIARLLAPTNNQVQVYITGNTETASDDFSANLKKLDLTPVSVKKIVASADLPTLSISDVIIDCLFGTGLNKPVTGIYREVIAHINQIRATIISIDLPSGLFADYSSERNAVVHASYTLTFQALKLAFLVAENEKYTGQVEVLDIGLNKKFYEGQKEGFHFTSLETARALIMHRSAFAHKGNFGHALLLAGSFGKMGAAVLAAEAIIHSGAGLLTCQIPQCGYNIMQSTVPEAMTAVDKGKKFLRTMPADPGKYAAAAIGPGIGVKKQTIRLVEAMLTGFKKPMVIDADGLNCIAVNKKLLDLIPPLTILTPHPKEFDRLFGDHKNDFVRINTAMTEARKRNIIIVLKGHHSLIATPRSGFFNSTGNSGLAKGGTGDVLTGIISSLLAQNYQPADAAVFGCYLHGLAGEQASFALTEECMSARDIVKFLPSAYRILRGKT